MGRTIAKNEISIIASDCLRCIRAEEDVIEMLEAKGFENPTETWYSIRRWIKSNRPADYVDLPPKWRIELPTQTIPVKDKHGAHTVKLFGPQPNENKAPTEPAVEEEKPKDPSEEPKPKKRGRPAGWKKPAKEEAEPDPVVSAPRIRVVKLESERFSFSKEDDGKISINKRGVLNYLIIDEDEAKELAKIIPIVVGMLKS